MRGRLIVCEGIDGSGKSTVARRVADALAEGGARVEFTQEPTKTWMGEAVRRAIREEVSPFVDAFLFMADHAAHVERTQALLAQGVTVVSDRWSDSTFAYQGAALAPLLAQRGVPDALAWLQEVERPFDLRPDLVLLLDLPVDRALARVMARGGATEKFERAEFLERVRANYQRLSKQLPGYRVIDASGAPDEVAARAVALARAALA